MIKDKSKIRKFHSLLSGLSLMDQKENILAQYGVESTLDLRVAELDEILARLKIAIDGKYKASSVIRSARSKVLTRLHELGIEPHGKDWTRVNSFLLNPRIAGKLLYEMNLADLTALDVKLRAIARKQAAKNEETKRLALEN